ncbi:MAG: three-Cys-motif partner protein TcmP [Anaerolineae bacterium]|nr:three-Cys-motif partner protein TcmP [Anaerolineae bacterium]
MPEKSHDFGGDWTTEKLERVAKYLKAYATIMKEKAFPFAYIDAFAGTGYRTLRRSDEAEQLMFPELSEAESQQFLDGSARKALQVQPRFYKYLFIEKDEQRFRALQKLRTEFPEVAGDIILVNAEANSYLQDMCDNRNWKKHRAVLFLDPYGMEVEWQTIEAIARTQAIDLWLLFPLGIAVNRLLKRDSNIGTAVRNALNRLFGAEDWYETFYETTTRISLFGPETHRHKVSDFDTIAEYMIKRLRTVFPGVAQNPLPLLNSRNNPLYLLCFAAGNPKGATTAVKIAQDILKR